MIRPRSPLVFLWLALAAAVAGCSAVNPPMQRLPEITFTNLPPFQLDVARIEVVSQYEPPAQAPHIEYDMPESPEKALRRWTQDRLKAVGRSGILRVAIRNAAATETPLKTEQGFSSMFEKQQAARLDMSIDVALQMLDERQFVVSEVTGRAEISHTETEGMKLNDRDKLLYDMVHDMLTGFDGEMDSKILSTFGRWLGAR